MKKTIIYDVYKSNSKEDKLNKLKWGNIKIKTLQWNFPIRENGWKSYETFERRRRK